MHGAGGGAPKGKANGMWQHSGRSTDTIKMRCWATELVREARELERHFQDETPVDNGAE